MNDGALTACRLYALCGTLHGLTRTNGVADAVEHETRAELPVNDVPLTKPALYATLLRRAGGPLLSLLLLCLALWALHAMATEVTYRQIGAYVHGKPLPDAPKVRVANAAIDEHWQQLDKLYDEDRKRRIAEREAKKVAE